MHPIWLFEADDRQDELFDCFARDGKVFVRPAGCQKTFTGCTVERGRFAEVLGPARYDPTTLVVVAEPRRIRSEWRLVVAESSVVAGSRYLLDENIDVAAGTPTAVRSFAERALNSVTWRPDDIFMLDVCEADDELYVLELGAFSCFAFYDCDPKSVVSAAGELARKAWEKHTRSAVS